MTKDEQNDLKEKRKSYDKYIRQLQDQKEKADFDDIRNITIRRTKIEQWIDEPFFRQTIQDLFVKVGNGKKFVLAQVKNVEEYEPKDDTKNNQYTMTNGKKTNLVLQLMVDEDRIEKYKIFKVNQISNQEVTDQDFKKLKMLRQENKLAAIMKDFIYIKQYDLKHARNYVYKHGEVERIARARFERALKTGDLHEFPNVAFFYK